MYSSSIPVTGLIFLKASSASSVPTTVPAPRDLRSARAANSANLHSPIADGFALTGVSAPPDPATHAYRKDLADTALAGLVIASHYAEPLVRTITTDTPAFATASCDGAEIASLQAGDQIRMLDCSRGWAWGYLPDGRVAYVSATAVRV